MIRILIPLTVLGCFCVLAAFAYGRITPTPESEGEFIARKLAEYRPSAAPVILARAEDRCGEDWACLVAWAGEKGKKQPKFNTLKDIK